MKLHIWPKLNHAITNDYLSHLI